MGQVLSKSHWLVIGSVGGLLLWLFAPALSGSYTFVFRDAAHFYHPLFEFVRDEWRAGRLPLWNPYENIGVPLAAENTSSVFYPGKLIFLLPLDYTFLYNLYIVSHVALAAWSSYYLARRWGASVLAAGLASLSYAFSGNVLFQHCNVVFLVGAAWLPVAILLAHRTFVEGRWQPAVGLGAVLAMMVLGGDPQMAYNVVLLTLLDGLLLWRSRSVASGENETRPRSGTWQFAGLFTLALVTGLLLSAVQILPSLESTRQSGRSVSESPRNLFELASHLAQEASGEAPRLTSEGSWYAELLGTAPSAHSRQVYQFSVGPWRAFEYLWPNISGQQFPVHRRWLSALPAEGRVWVPSLYMGLLPFLLAIVTWTLQTPDVRVRWMSWAVLLSAVASLGGYGLIWVVGELRWHLGQDNPVGVGDEVGGLYWLMTVVLPGYVYFRYPAKCLIVMSLALSLLAAWGWDQAWQAPSARLRRWLIRLCVVSLAGVCVLMLLGSTLGGMLEHLTDDQLFGPLDTAGAGRDVALALMQTVLLSAAFASCFRERAIPQGTRWMQTVVLLLTAVDLAIAQHWLVPYAPAVNWSAEPAVLESLPLLATATSGDRLYRAPGFMPESWQRTSSSGRLLESLHWDRETLRPKYPLPYLASMVEASETMLPYDYQVLLSVARAHGEPTPDGPLPHASVLDLLGVRFAMLFQGVPPETMQPLVSPAEEALFYLRPTALAHAWIVHEVEVLPSLSARVPTEIHRRTEEVLFGGGRPRDWRQVAVVETDEPLPYRPELPKDRSQPETCRIVQANPLAVEIEVRLASPGLVVLSDLDYPGWELEVETGGISRIVSILRTNRVMRGVTLPEGDHRLFYRYRPRSVMVGGVVSGLAWTLLALVAISLQAWQFRKRTPVEVQGVE